MKSKKLFYMSLLLCSGITLWTSCDKIKDATSKEVEVASISLDIKDIPVVETKSSDNLLRADALNSFSLTKTITFEEIKGFSSDFGRYDPSHFQLLSAQSAQIVVTPSAGDGTLVQNLVISSGSLSYTIPSYSFGDTYSVNALVPFVTGLLEQLRKSESGLPVSVSGQTDLPKGASLNVNLKVLNATYKISLL